MNSSNRSILSAAIGLVLGTSTLLVGTAHADGDVIPHALVRYEHNSNLLLLPESPLPIGVTQLDDNLLEYDGGIDVNYRVRDNRFYLTSNISRFNYQYYKTLDHNGFAGVAGLDWVATHKVNGNVNYQYNRHQLSFASISGLDVSRAYIETTQAFRANGVYTMNSRWSTNLAGSYTTASLPKEAGTNGVSYDLKVNQVRAGVTYTGAASLKTGLAIDHESGQYDNSNNTSGNYQPSFTRTLYEYTADYKIGAKTSFGGSVGYTTRTQGNIGNSTTIGSLSFNQQLTVKTGYYFQFRRSLDTYNTTAGSQLSTSGIVGVTWQATPKISVSGNYDYTKAQVSGTGGFAARDDKLRLANVSLKYNMLRWLAVTPYYRYQKRDSNDAMFNYKANIYGIDLEARFLP